MAAAKVAYSPVMEGLRVLPYLSASCRRAIKESGAKSVEVAALIGRVQNTVDRFLKGETYPRGGELDDIVLAVAKVSMRPAGELWKEAISDAIEKEREAGVAKAKAVAKSVPEAKRR